MALSTSKVALASLSLLAASAVFNARAEAVHPILDADAGATTYRADLSKVVSKVIGSQGTTLARGAEVHLEEALRNPMNRPQMVVYPTDLRAGEAVVVLATPPHVAYNSASIPVCVEQNRQVLGKWQILTSGQVVVDESPITLKEGKTPCQSWIIPQGMAWMQQQGVQVKAQVSLPRLKVGG